jgi:predicted RNA-binding protein with PIN domain
VEAALRAARAGLSADPAVPPPSALRPYLDFARQSPMSLAAIARVVDSDPEFRARVVADVDESEIGRAPWLWLARPDGWEGELAAIETEAAAQASAANEQREERAASRKLGAAQAALRRAEVAAAASLEQLDVVREELAGERSGRLAAEARVAELEATVRDLGADRAGIVRNLKDTEARLVERGTALNALRARLRKLEGELEAERRFGRDEPGPRATVAPAPEPTGAPAPDLPAVAQQVAHAAEGVAALAEALHALARLVAGERADVRATDAAEVELGTEALGGRSATANDDGRVTPLRRTPVALPGGVFDDSLEAAEHLLRVQGGRLVVDGYNVTMQAWPELGAAEQRRRLLTGLSDLAHRYGSAVDVVFDGADVEPPAVPAPARRLVRARFSPVGVEADDVVIDLVGRIPVATPVVVVSSDKRVREGARRAGANLLHARQLLALLGR